MCTSEAKVSFLNKSAQSFNGQARAPPEAGLFLLNTVHAASVGWHLGPQSGPPQLLPTFPLHSVLIPTPPQSWLCLQSCAFIASHSQFLSLAQKKGTPKGR